MALFNCDDWNRELRIQLKKEEDLRKRLALVTAKLEYASPNFINEVLNQLEEIVEEYRVLIAEWNEKSKSLLDLL